DSIWIGLICDSNDEFWVWQDGQSLEYSHFYENPGPSCPSSNNIAVDTSKYWRTFGPEIGFDFCICARR
ncbi:hypothetical protein PENTCL1PPCAC_4509, partial [Pristionchus entomophagus]